MTRSSPRGRATRRRGRLLPSSAPTTTSSCRSEPIGAPFLPVENSEALLRESTAATSRFSRGGSSGNVEPVRKTRQQVPPPPLAPPAEANKPLGTPTGNAYVIQRTETLKELRPRLERLLTNKLAARFPGNMESIISLMVNAIMPKHTDESVRKPMVNVSMSNLF